MVGYVDQGEAGGLEYAAGYAAAWAEKNVHESMHLDSLRVGTYIPEKRFDIVAGEVEGKGGVSEARGR
jgi:hypothetical protein